jgi:hypothetical protein
MFCGTEISYFCGFLGLLDVVTKDAISDELELT